MRCASETRRNAPRPVEAPGAPLGSYSEARLVVAVDELVGDLAGGVFEGELEGLRPEPLDVDDW